MQVVNVKSKDFGRWELNVTGDHGVLLRVDVTFGTLGVEKDVGFVTANSGLSWDNGHLGVLEKLPTSIESRARQ